MLLLTTFFLFFVCSGARLQRAHERIATKKFYLPLVTRSRGGRRGESGREWSDVSWNENGLPAKLEDLSPVNIR